MGPKDVVGNVFRSPPSPTTPTTQQRRMGLETRLEPLLLVCVSYNVATCNTGTNRARPAIGRGRISRDESDDMSRPLRYVFVLFPPTILMIIDYVHFYRRTAETAGQQREKKRD